MIRSRFLKYDRDKQEVTAFLLKNKAYLEFQDGKRVTEATTREIFYGELPPGKTYADKQILGYYIDAKLICIVDILKNYPNGKTWVIGLLLLDEAKRGQQIGKAIYQLVESFLLENNATVIRLGVLEDNEAGKSFWEKNGFSRNGEFKMHVDNRKIFVLEKIIGTGS